MEKNEIEKQMKLSNKKESELLENLDKRIFVSMEKLNNRRLIGNADYFLLHNQITIMKALQLLITKSDRIIQK